MNEGSMSGVAEQTLVAHTFLNGLRDRNWEMLKSVMTEDIEWSLPGSSLISGRAVGAEAVIDRAKLIVSYGLDFALLNILYGENGVTLSLNNTAQRGALVLNEFLSTVCLLREGKIYAINTYLSDVDMVNAFFV